ncbi:MAG: alpha/beta fold hydrolase [Desulfovibrionaceae bacterium]|nr:alpha/beta fold hydrolase [Desulfovibrionaceae bacterium]
MRATLLLTLALLLLPPALLAAAEAPYPFDDPYQATVFGTPADMRYAFKAPVRPEVRAIRIEDRRVPQVFSYSRDMFFSTALQDGPAPLLFLIAGTGAEHNSAKMIFLTQVFHEAGYHVAALSSPTHMNFVAAASDSRVPGFVPNDVADLNRVMGWVREELAKECSITGYAVAGYSLGGLHAAFLAERDKRTGEFGFSHVVMINPPVSLIRSVTRLDSWLTGRNLGRMTVHERIQDYLDRFSDYYLNADVTDLDDDFLFRMIKEIGLEKQDFKALIGAAFRISSASMIFTSDVCLRAGYLVPPDDYPLRTDDPLLPYAQQAFNISFNHYLDEYLLPYLQYQNPQTTREEVVRLSSLEAIRPFLENEEKVRMVGNRDDVILDDGDVAFLAEVLGARARFFDHGGHCGNLMYPAFVQALFEAVRP